MDSVSSANARPGKVGYYLRFKVWVETAENLSTPHFMTQCLHRKSKTRRFDMLSTYDSYETMIDGKYE